MATALPKEIVLETKCPLCYDSGQDNPLRTAAGTFGTYCVGPDGYTRPHFFDDTAILRTLIAKMNEKRSLAARREAPPTPKPEPEPQPVESASARFARFDAEAERKKALQGEPEVVSSQEPTGFQVSETDAGRLSELLQQPITDSGTLVGVIWTMRNDVNQVVAENVRQAAAAVEPGLVPIPQRADGLALQIFMPWRGNPLENVAWKLADKSNFNGVTPRQFAQDIFENIAATNYFPPDDLPNYAMLDPRGEGYWILVNVPETYIGAMMEKAQTSGRTPQKYLQDYFLWMADSELFP